MLSSLQKFNPLGAATSVGLRSALPKVLMGAALLGGAGSVLFAGSAQAACNENVPFVTWASGTALTCEDKTFTYAPSSDLPAAAVDAVRASVDSGVYLFSYDFNQSSDIEAFTLNYIATATSPFFFTEVDIDSTVPNQAPSENLEATWRTGSFAGPVVATLASVNGSADIALVEGNPQTLYVTNVYASNGGVIDSFQNSYRQSTTGTRVPGPLPLVGAGMAFGFSRKLRSRIKARVQA